MPADYIAVRDSCIEKKKKKNGGKISKKEEQSCKEMAAIWYYKKHGKTVKESNATLALSDRVYYDRTYYNFLLDILKLEI